MLLVSIRKIRESPRDSAGFDCKGNFPGAGLVSVLTWH